MKQRFTIAGMILLFSVVCMEDSFAQKSGCGLRATDSVYLGGGPVYRDCDVDRKARIKTRPTFIPPARMPDKQCMAAEFEFVVDTLGWPEYETVRLIRTNDGSYADATKSMIREMVFAPAEKDGAKVRQIYQHKSALSVAVSAGTGRRPMAPRMGC